MKIYISLPAFKQVNLTPTTSSLMALGKALLAAGHDWYFSTHSYPDIAESRNIQTTIWMDRTDAEWMLQVDDDMSFEPELVLDMLRFNQPVTGVLYPVKAGPLRFVGELLPEPYERRDGFMAVKDTGAGLFLTHRSAIAAMLENGAAVSDSKIGMHSAGELLGQLGISRIIRAYDPIETERGKLSEDKSFCRRHRDCGGTVWANIEHPVTHYGLHGFSGTFATVGGA